MNRPDMRLKVKEYITELIAEVRRIEKNDYQDYAEETIPIMIMRARTLEEVINDLQSRLDELV